MNALKVFAESLLVMLKDFLTSKKVLTAVLTAVAGAVFKDPAVRDRVVAAGLLLLAGFAAADHGATAAKIGAAAPTPPAPKVVLPEFKGALTDRDITPVEHASAVGEAVKAALLEALERTRKESAAPPAPPDLTAAAVRTALAPLVPQGAPPLVPAAPRLQGTSPGGTT